jgi:hypothetical protein
MANPTGWGRGIYVKGKAPVPAYHPWCKCKLLNREDLDPNYDKPGPKQSAVQYLKTLDEKEAARIVGSKAKWQRVLAGEKLQDVIDGGKPDMYKLKLIKDIAPVKTAPRKQDEPKAYVSPHDFVVHNGTTSEAFKRRVDNAVSLIPENIQQQIIRANGLKITSCQYVTEELPELKGVHPRGWDKLTWANTDGVHYSGKGSYVSERWMHPWHMVDEVSTRTEKVVLHETGHMLEEFLLKNSKDYLEFSNAYNNDIALLTPEQKFDAEYFIQKGKAGREETFAELFSQILMRNGNIKDSESFVLEYFPKSKKVLENAILSYGK